MIYLLFVLIFFTGCNKDTLIDFDSCDGIEAKLIYTTAKGETLSVKDDVYSFDLNLSQIKPWKLQFSNVDGGETELALGVYKKSPYHDELARRLFLYNIDFKNKRLKPKLRMSRLSNPLVDFCMTDIDGDGFDEIVSIEKTIDAKFTINVYDYANSFVFERNYKSKKLDNEPVFVDKKSTVRIDEIVYDLFLDGGEIKWQRKDI